MAGEPGAPERVPADVWWAVAGLVTGAGGGLLIAPGGGGLLVAPGRAAGFWSAVGRAAGFWSAVGRHGEVPGRPRATSRVES